MTAQGLEDVFCCGLCYWFGVLLLIGLGKVRLLERRTGVRMDAIMKDVLVILDTIAY